VDHPVEEQVVHLIKGWNPELDCGVFAVANGSESADQADHLANAGTLDPRIIRFAGTPDQADCGVNGSSGSAGSLVVWTGSSGWHCIEWKHLDHGTLVQWINGSGLVIIRV
jgi:hypothetical protein